MCEKIGHGLRDVAVVQNHKKALQTSKRCSRKTNACAIGFYLEQTTTFRDDRGYDVGLFICADGLIYQKFCLRQNFRILVYTAQTSTVS